MIGIESRDNSKVASDIVGSRSVGRPCKLKGCSWAANSCAKEMRTEFEGQLHRLSCWRAQLRNWTSSQHSRWIQLVSVSPTYFSMSS